VAQILCEAYLVLSTKRYVLVTVRGPNACTTRAWVDETYEISLGTCLDSFAPLANNDVL